MSNDRRVWMIVVAIGLSLAVLSIVSGRLAEIVYPPPEPMSTGFDGEVRPGGEATAVNFARLRPGMGRHEVWSILGPSAGQEGSHFEWWDGPDFKINVEYNSPGDRLTTGGEIVFKGGKRNGMGN
jgi:hypothetical protein